MTKLDAALAAKLCAEFLFYADRFGITAEVVNGAIPESNLRALAEQLMAALEELTRLRSDEATMKLSRMLGLGDPVRPDIHAAVCRQRDAALREVERMRAVYAHAIEWHRVRVPGMQQHDRFIGTEDALWDAIDTALKGTGDE